MTRSVDLLQIHSAGGVPFTVAREYADQFKALIDDLEANGYPLDAIQSGGYNPRNIAGTNTPSKHASGRAIDINWNDNPHGGAPGDIPPFLADSLARKHGMEWGGLWAGKDRRSVPLRDPMHFEIGRSPPAVPAGLAQTPQAPAGQMGLGAGLPSQSGQFDTALTPEEETQFQKWKAQYAPNDSGVDYDLRGAFKTGLTPDANTGHWPDTYKKPNHPTFSNESMYAKDRPDLAGHWKGDQYVPAADSEPDHSYDGLPPNLGDAPRRAEPRPQASASWVDGPLGLMPKWSDGQTPLMGFAEGGAIDDGEPVAQQLWDMIPSEDAVVNSIPGLAELNRPVYSGGNWLGPARDDWGPRPQEPLQKRFADGGAVDMAMSAAERRLRDIQHHEDEMADQEGEMRSYDPGIADRVRGWINDIGDKAGIPKYGDRIARNTGELSDLATIASLPYAAGIAPARAALMAPGFADASIARSMMAFAPEGATVTEGSAIATPMSRAQIGKDHITGRDPISAALLRNAPAQLPRTIKPTMGRWRGLMGPGGEPANVNAASRGALNYDKALYAQRPPRDFELVKRASGGMVGPTTFNAPGPVVQPVHGPLKSKDGGRTDTLPISVRSGSFVIPADVVSALGEGNTDAGQNVVHSIFYGPYGIKPLGGGRKIAGSKTTTKTTTRNFAAGGPVEILAAGGEHVLPPEIIAKVGNGDLDQGFRTLDAFVKKVRKDHIKTLKTLPPPAR